MLLSIALARLSYEAACAERVWWDWWYVLWAVSLLTDLP